MKCIPVERCNIPTKHYKQNKHYISERLDPNLLDPIRQCCTKQECLDFVYIFNLACKLRLKDSDQQ